MNTAQSSTVSINSQIVSNNIESEIIRLTKILQVENTCDINDAKETVKHFILKLLFTVIPEEDKDNLKIAVSDVLDKIKNNPKNEELLSTYRIFKFFYLSEFLE